MKILDIIYKGKGIKQYKRSYHHPLLHRRFYCDNFNYFTVTKMWNIKIYVPYCEFMYEKGNPHIAWEWKLEIKREDGKYIVPLRLLFEKSGLYEVITKKEKIRGIEYIENKEEKVSDEDMFIFYK